MRRLHVSAIAAALIVVSAIVASAQGEEASDRPAIPSAGCGVSKVGADNWGQMDIDGVSRTWRSYVPAAHDGVTPLPLVILLHGGGGDSGQIGFLTEDGFADEQGFVALAPQANVLWMWDDVESVEPDLSMANPDLVFIDALIERLGEDLCLDLARVYATGFSWGGVGLAALSCALEDRIAAIAPVGLTVDFGDACVQDRPVPMLAFHSTNDPLAPFEGGLSPNFPDVGLVDWPGWDASIPDRVASIAARNGCEPEPRSEMLTADIGRLIWTCPAGADVEFVVTNDETHGWPGSHVTDSWTSEFGATTDINATEMMWDFFEQHPMPE